MFEVCVTQTHPCCLERLQIRMRPKTYSGLARPRGSVGMFELQSNRVGGTRMQSVCPPATSSLFAKTRVTRAVPNQIRFLHYDNEPKITCGSCWVCRARGAELLGWRAASDRVCQAPTNGSKNRKTIRGSIICQTHRSIIPEPTLHSPANCRFATGACREPYIMSL